MWLVVEMRGNKHRGVCLFTASGEQAQKNTDKQRQPKNIKEQHRTSKEQYVRAATNTEKQGTSHKRTYRR